MRRARRGVGLRVRPAGFVRRRATALERSDPILERGEAVLERLRESELQALFERDDVPPEVDDPPGVLVQQEPALGRDPVRVRKVLRELVRGSRERLDRVADRLPLRLQVLREGGDRSLRGRSDAGRHLLRDPFGKGRLEVPDPPLHVLAEGGVDPFELVEPILDRLQPGEQVRVSAPDEHVDVGLARFLAPEKEVEHPVLLSLRLREGSPVEPIADLPVVQERLELFQHLEPQGRGRARPGRRPTRHRGNDGTRGAIYVGRWSGLPRLPDRQRRPAPGPAWRIVHGDAGA